jgi:hypothetical protein
VNAIQTVQALVDALADAETFIMVAVPMYARDRSEGPQVLARIRPPLSSGRALLAQFQAGETARPTDAQLAAGAFYPQVHNYGTPSYAAAPVVAQMLTDALANGYGGSVMTSDTDGGSITIHYDKREDAEAAHDALCRAIDAKNGLTLPEGGGNA